jgi:PleD family two-component response regulator
MSSTRLKALLVTPNLPLAGEVGKKLNDEGYKFEVTHAQWLASAQEHLASTQFDVLLLSLVALDGKYSSLAQLQDSLPNSTILVIASATEQADAVRAIQHGADDSLVINGLSGKMLRQIVFNAINRKQMLRDIQNAGCEDSATGLYTLEGFESLAQRLFDSCRQQRSRVYVLTVRIEGASQPVLAKIAESMRGVCRKSEILPSPSLSRVSEGEFALLVSADSFAEVQRLMQRIQETLQKMAGTSAEGSKWSIVFGMAAYDPEYPSTPACVLDRARQNLALTV